MKIIYLPFLQLREVVRDYTTYRELDIVDSYFKWDTPKHAKSYVDVTSPEQSSFVIVNHDESSVQQFWVSIYN